MDILVDTSILIDFLRNYPPALSWRSANSHLIAGITPIAWMEVIDGASDKVRQTRAARFLTQFQMVYLSQADVDWAMRSLQQYRLSHSVGILDCLIAAPCPRLNLPLYTRNLKHFAPLLGTLAQQPY